MAFSFSNFLSWKNSYNLLCGEFALPFVFLISRNSICTFQASDSSILAEELNSLLALSGKLNTLITRLPYILPDVVLQP